MIQIKDLQKNKNREVQMMKVDIYNTNKKYNIIYADPPWHYRTWRDGTGTSTK